MSLLKKRFGHFGPVEFFELGRSKVPTLLMTVIFYKLDGILIDSGSAITRRDLPVFHGAEIPRSLYLTHFHEDHTGNVAHFIRSYGLQAYGHPYTAEKLRNGFSVLPYEMLMFGAAEPANILEIGTSFKSENYTFDVIKTPGHTPDHQCFYVKSEGWLFSGDMYVADMIRIWRKPENLKQQIESLEILSVLDFDVIFCAHNPQFSNGKNRILAKLENFRNFYGEVKEHRLKGLSPRETMRAMKIKERWLVRILTTNDVCVEYMVRSVYEAEAQSSGIR